MIQTQGCHITHAAATSLMDFQYLKFYEPQNPKLLVYFHYVLQI